MNISRCQLDYDVKRGKKKNETCFIDSRVLSAEFAQSTVVTRPTYVTQCATEMGSKKKCFAVKPKGRCDVFVDFLWTEPVSRSRGRY